MATEKRLIDADAFKMFLEVVRQDYLEEDTFSSDFAAEVIETVQDEYLAKFPTVDAVEVVHGRWIKDGDVVVCSNCGEEHGWDEYRATYCEDCGAKMDELRTDE